MGLFSIFMWPLFRTLLTTNTSEKYGYVIESDDWTNFIPNSGKMIWDNKEEYVGELKNFAPHGKGTMTHPNGRVETGVWKKGILKKKLNSSI